MLAILEDGFSIVSQVNYSEHLNNQTGKKAEVQLGTSASILSKLLKIDVTGDFNRADTNDTNSSIAKEKIHTNTSLLSKFRSYLLKEELLRDNLETSEIHIGDFVEIEGELQKNPIIAYLDTVLEIFHLADVFSKKPELNEKAKAKVAKQNDNLLIKQVKGLADDLTNSGTIDFILSDSKCKAVLSAQKQYLANENISELIGGRFKVLGKVISICSNSNDNIDLLRKTTLSVLPENTLDDIVKSFKGNEKDQLRFPELITKIDGPAVILIPIAIYA